MSNEVDTTQWSLPGPADAPRDDLKLQLEVYGETILLRGFENDSAWVRTVSADEIANVFTQHLGFSSGLLPQEALWWNQGETGQVVALWRPPQVWSGGPATGGVQAPRTGSGFPCRGWSSSARRAGRPGSTLRLSRPADPEQHLFRSPGLQRLQGRASLSRKPPVPRRRGTDTGSPSSSPTSRLTGDTRERSKKHPDNLHHTMGGARWNRLTYPIEDLVPQCTVAHAMAVSEGRLGYR